MKTFALVFSFLLGSSAMACTVEEALSSSRAEMSLVFGQPMKVGLLGVTESEYQLIAIIDLTTAVEDPGTYAGTINMSKETCKLIIGKGVNFVPVE